jgi:5'-nucleotidase
MKILLTNDDGICAPGLVSLKSRLLKLARVVVVAPEQQHSAASHSITLFEPLIVRHFIDPQGVHTYAVKGTPTDCVKLALREIMSHPPDLVVSGINYGLNAGSNVLYSGTVAGALEATQFGVMAIAISLQYSENPDFNFAATIGKRLITRLAGLRGGNLAFNINIPACRRSEIKGIKITRQEQVPYQDSFDRRKDPRGRLYYWIKGSTETDLKLHITDGEGKIPTDLWAIKHRYISITPIKRDVTDYRVLDRIKRAGGLNIW